MSSTGKMKWTPAADQQLLLTVIQAHQLSVDCVKVAEIWEAKDGVTPTPRAVKERIAKMKELAKNPAGSSATSTSPTPKKTRATPSGGKGKAPASRAPKKHESDSDSPSPVDKSTKKSGKGGMKHMRRTPSDDEA